MPFAQTAAIIIPIIAVAIGPARQGKVADQLRIRVQCNSYLGNAMPVVGRTIENVIACALVGGGGAAAIGKQVELLEFIEIGGHPAEIPSF